MKTLLQQMLFLDEKTGKFSTSKFMVLVSFYLTVAMVIKAAIHQEEMKNASFMIELLMISSSLYFGRRFSFKAGGVEASGDKSNEKDS